MPAHALQRRPWRPSRLAGYLLAATACVATPLLGPGPAHAQSKSRQAKTLHEVALDRYDGKQYEAAADAWLQAYGLDAKPKYKVNAAFALGNVSARACEAVQIADEASRDHARWLAKRRQQPVRQRLEAERTANQATCERVFAWLTVTSQPSGARVYATAAGERAERDLGETPLRVRVARAAHALRVVKDGYSVLRDSVDLTTGSQSAALTLVSQNAPGVVEVVGVPAPGSEPGAEDAAALVVVDGKMAKASPDGTYRASAPPGVRAVVVTMTDGRRFEGACAVAPAGRCRVDVVLPAPPDAGLDVRTGAWVGYGVGAGLAVLSGALYGVAWLKDDEARTATGDRLRSLQAEGEALWISSIVGASVAAAAVITGVVLTFVEPSGGDASPSGLGGEGRVELGVAPAFGGGLSGVAAQVRF